MKWFRHFSNASSSAKVQRIMDDMGLIGYAQWFLLLEILNEKYDGESDVIDIHFKEISAKVQIKFGKKLETFMEKLVNFSLISYEKSGNFYKIKCPMLFELMSKDSKYNRKRVVKNAQLTNNRYKIEEVEVDKEEKIYKKETKADDEQSTKKTKKAKVGGRSKNYDTPHQLLSLSSGCLETLKFVSHDAKKKWLETYSPNFVIQELEKAYTWLIENQQEREPAQFYGNWFRRSWPKVAHIYAGESELAEKKKAFDEKMIKFLGPEQFPDFFDENGVYRETNA